MIQIVPEKHTAIMLHLDNITEYIKKKNATSLDNM